MEQQLSFADSECHNKRHQTRKEKFLARMDALAPGSEIDYCGDSAMVQTREGAR